MKEKKDECIQVGIPKSWIIKLIPYIITVILSGGSFAGVNYMVTSSPENYEEEFTKFQTKYDNLNGRLVTVESVQRTILVQLSDIKEQTKTNSEISNKILLLLSSK